MPDFGLLKRKECVLIVVDFQEKLLPAIHDFTSVLDREVKMVTAAYTLQVPVLFTQHYTAGLGMTHVALRTLRPEFSYVEKNTFNAFEAPAFVEQLAKLDARTLVIMGTEAHICVCQTALGALQRGYGVHIVADASGSRKNANKEIGLERIRQAGGVITASELVIYEWVGRSDGDEFRALLPLLK
ncbi:MAG: isochorismatase family protein [Negativicutes bacterium]